jgi:hypothetical protein
MTVLLVYVSIISYTNSGLSSLPGIGGCVHCTEHSIEFNTHTPIDFVCPG